MKKISRKTLSAYLLDEVAININTNFLVAGGAIRDIFSQGIVEKDIDILVDAQKVSKDTFDSCLINIWKTKNTSKFPGFENLKENTQYENVFVYKIRNWQITTEERWHAALENVTIQISYHPNIKGFFNMVSEDMNAILYDGKKIKYVDGAIEKAQNKEFSLLNFDSKFMDVTRAEMILARIEKFKNRNYILVFNENTEQILNEIDKIKRGENPKSITHNKKMFEEEIFL